MASTAQTYFAARVRPFALSIPAQIGLLLIVHVALWTWVGMSSRSNFDGAGDMVEAYAWAQQFQWGYYKHPPLSAWVAGLWFAVVPATQLGYSLLAALNGAVGLAGLTWLAREFLPRRWVLLVVALASLAPGITALAMRFNANAILVSTWPWAIALFVRLMRHGRARDAVLCGIACALAMLGKYYSAVLLLSLLASALWLPGWRARLATAPVALAALVCMLCLAPHLNWLLAQSHGPIEYARAATGHQSPTQSWSRAVHFGLAQVVFPLLAFTALQRSLVGPAHRRAFWQAATAPLRPRDEPLWLIAMLPVVATVVITVATGARTASVWGLAIAAGLALLAAGRAHETGAQLSLRRLWTTLAMIWIAVALLSPLWWHSRAAVGTPSVIEPREEMAQALDRAWRLETGSALPWISGTRKLAASTAFYAADHPRYWSLWDSAVETPWVDRTDVERRGALIVCDEDDVDCQQRAEIWTADRRELSVAKSARGYHFEPRSYVFYFVHPRALPRSH